jgi:hypothetical protein
VNFSLKQAAVSKKLFHNTVQFFSFIQVAKKTFSACKAQDKSFVG